MYQSLFLIFLTAGLAVALNAEAVQLQLDRSSAVQRALYGNRDLRAARFAIEEAKGRTIDSGAWRNPSLNFTGASDFAFSDEGEYGWSIGLEQRFPVTGRLRVMRSIAQLEVQLAELEVQEAGHETALNVERAFDAILADDEQLALHREQIVLNRKLADFLARKIDRAEASPLDLTQLEVSLASLEQSVLRLERTRASHLAQFRQLLGLDLEQPMHVKPAMDTDMPDSLPEYTQAQLPEHLEYQLALQLSEIATEQTNLARAERWQDIAIELFYEEGLANNAIEDNFTGNIRVGAERERFLGVGLSIPLPVYNQNRGEIASRRARERQLTEQVAALGYRLLSRAALLRAEFIAVQQQLADYDAAVLVRAEQNLRDIESAYTGGLVDLTTVFRAQERVLELKLQRAELRATCQQILTQWRYATHADLHHTLIHDDHELENSH